MAYMTAANATATKTAMMLLRMMISHWALDTIGLNTRVMTQNTPRLGNFRLPLCED